MAAFCGLGAILLAILFPEGNRYSYVIFTILLFFADTIRPRVGYMVTVAFMLAAVVLYWLKKQKNKNYISIAFIMQTATYAINALYEKFNGWTVFREFHPVKSNWIAYPHPSFQDNSALYENVGWTEKLYNLASKWFFMDRRINTEAFKSLNNEIDSTSFFSWNDLRGFLLSQELRMTFFVIALLIIITTIVCIYKRKLKCAIAIWAGTGITAGIILYFLYTGRLPYRVSFSIIILFALPVLFIFARSIIDIQKKKRFAIGACIVGVIVIMCSILSNYGLLRIAYSSSNNISLKTQIKKDVEQYAIDHPDNFYIYDYTLTMAGDPFTLYSNGKPYNLTFWGGAQMYSPPYYDQLATNGFDEFYSDRFFDENVFFMGKEEPDIDLILYMKDEFSENVSVEVVDDSTNFLVYRFVNLE